MMGGIRDICVIIPHYSGDQLLECLHAIAVCSDQPCDVYVVDDRGPASAIDKAIEQFPEIHVIRNERNLGFVGACNNGLHVALESSAKYALLLNDDALVEDGWADAIISAMESGPRIAACQPKIVQASEPSRFDYAGGAGGLMDRYGYPFGLGRWFDTLEQDTGQYDTPVDIFWASGTAVCMRLDTCREIGVLEPLLEMHMEEIDWCWRAIIAGWRVVNVPATRVRHYGALSLKTESYRKAYLNHRNSVMLLLKNYTPGTLVRVLPVRIFLELITILGGIVAGKWTRVAASFMGMIGAFTRLPGILHARQHIAETRKRSDEEVSRWMYPRSIALRYLLGRPTPPTGESLPRIGIDEA
jgi:GT2 family glycosyltransferase